MSVRNRYENLENQHSEILVDSLDGIFTIASHTFAPSLDNDQLLEKALELGLPETDRDAAEQAIAATGFTRRFLFHEPDSELDVNETLERTARIGATLLKKAMSRHGWDDLDVFCDSSAFLPTKLGRLVLLEAGLDPDQIYSRSYRYACAGAVGAMVDVLSDDNLRDARVAVAALEPLSALLDPTQFVSPSRLAIPAIFGDDYAVTLLNPSRIRLHHRKIRIQPDGGVIKLRTLYDPTATQQVQLQVPSYYDFPQGQDIFSYGHLGAFLKIEPPADYTTAEMDGIRTGLFFGDQAANLILEVLEELGEPSFLRKLAGQNLIMHPASEPVVNRIAKKLNRAKAIDGRTLPFIMGQIGRSNSSSATTLVNCQNLIRQGRVTHNSPFFLVAPGIGSAIVAAAGEFC